MKLSVGVLIVFCAAVSMAAQSTMPALTRHIEAAQKAQAQQNCATAAAEYTAAVRLLPTSGELRTNQGIALYCNHQFTDAVTVFQKALQLKPGLAVPHLFLGLSAFHLSNTALAIRELEMAVRMMPADINGNLWLGYAYLADHRHEDAIERFNAVIADQPGNVDARYALGQAYFESGRSKVRQLQTLAPHGRGIKLLIMQEKALQGGTTADAANVLVEWKSTQEEQLYREASEAEKNARAALQIVLDEAPDSDRAHEILGETFSLQRNNEAAIREYRMVLQKNPALPGVRLALANCLMQMSQFQDALAVLIKEQEIQPGSGDVWASTGKVQLALGKDQDALKSLQHALALPDHSPEALLLMGKTLLRLGEAKAAVPILEQALRDGADSSTTNYFLARAYRSTGDRMAMTKALQSYQRTSRDAAERQEALALTVGPKDVRAGMTEQEEHDASIMPAQEQH